MFSISVEVSAPDFDKFRMEVPCPICLLETATTFGEVRRQEIIICRGCHANIHLEDHLGDFHRVRSRLKSLFKSMEI